MFGSIGMPAKEWKSVGQLRTRSHPPSKLEKDSRPNLTELVFDAISLQVGKWRGKKYNTKQVEVYAVPEDKDWLVITLITRYF